MSSPSLISKTSSLERVSTGVPGLEEILGGGLPSNRIYVVQGEPGSGKTTLAVQFLLEGIRNHENVLYVTFSETAAELNAVAASHGWDLSKLNIIDLAVLENQFSLESQTTLFHPSEVQLTQMTDLLMEKIGQLKPKRVVFDSVSEMRLLAENPYRYRRQILALKHALSQLKVTVFFLDDLTSISSDIQVQSIAHGVIGLFRMATEFGGERRRMRIMKLRGVGYVEGFHDYVIRRGGVQIFPRLVSKDYEPIATNEKLSSGIPEFDALLVGGLDRGTANLFIGPAGTGKSTLAMQHALMASQQGDQIAYFTFDETLNNLKRRSESLNLKIESALTKENFILERISPTELSPGEFAGKVRSLVEEKNLRVLVIDSLNGYIQSMPQEHFLLLQLHELLGFLSNKGVLTIMVVAQAGMIGNMSSPVDLTYLADTVVLTRFFEASGSVQRAISVIKKRTGKHENTLREYSVQSGGIKVGRILNEFEGILTGVPRLRCSSSSEASPTEMR